MLEKKPKWVQKKGNYKEFNWDILGIEYILHKKLCYRLCKCPPHLQQVCKHAKITDCKDLAEIIEALTVHDESKSLHFNS